MLSIFESACEDDVRTFTAHLRKKLAEKFDVHIGQAKLLHTVAELNGYRNWQSMKPALCPGDWKKPWLITLSSLGDLNTSSIAPTLDSALNRFLQSSEMIIRLLGKHASWKILGQDYDSGYVGLYLFLGERLMLSMTSATINTGVDGRSIEELGLDLPQLAGLCTNVLSEIGSETNHVELRENAMNSMVARELELDAVDMVLEHGRRDIINDDLAVDKLKNLMSMKQYVEFTAMLLGEH